MKRPRHNHSTRNISRFDYGRSHGWLVRVTRGEETDTKFFSDGPQGLTAKSLMLAQRYRDQLLRAVGKANRGGRKKSLGVSRIYREYRSYRHYTTGTLVYYHCWSVWLRGWDGKARHTSYSIGKHGSSAARQMARDWANRKLDR